LLTLYWKKSFFGFDLVKRNFTSAAPLDKRHEVLQRLQVSCLVSQCSTREYSKIYYWSNAHRAW